MKRLFRYSRKGMENAKRIVSDENAKRKFAHSRKNSGLLLIGSAICALIWANLSPETYFHFWEQKFSFGFEALQLSKTLREWINEGFMTLFFFVVGLEIKREILIGDLSSLKKASLPAFAAFGGMFVPAGIYLALNFGGTPEGWGIPIATDIAFAIGILALLGNRVPNSLKTFLLAIAIADDIGAILVIAFFYTVDLSISALIMAAGIYLLLIAANRLRIASPMVYGLLGLALWLAFLRSGVHSTISGVLLAFAVPSSSRFQPDFFLKQAEEKLDELRDREEPNAHAKMPSDQQHETLKEIYTDIKQTMSLLVFFELGLAGLVNTVILPLFALANAGISIGIEQLILVGTPVGLGVFLGLVIGKPVGLVLFSLLSERIGLAHRSELLSWPAIIGIGCLAGIGFTMSLFIMELALGHTDKSDAAKVSILLASLCSAIIGGSILFVKGNSQR